MHDFQPMHIPCLHAYLYQIIGDNIIFYTKKHINSFATQQELLLRCFSLILIVLFLKHQLFSNAQLLKNNLILISVGNVQTCNSSFVSSYRERALPQMRKTAKNATYSKNATQDNKNISNTKKKHHFEQISLLLDFYLFCN